VPNLADGFKLDPDHRADCFCKDDPEGLVFICPDRTRPLDFTLKRNGYRGGSTLWLRYACNDPNCPARAWVRWDKLSEFVTAGVASAAERS